MDVKIQLSIQFIKQPRQQFRWKISTDKHKLYTKLFLLFQLCFIFLKKNNLSTAFKKFLYQEFIIKLNFFSFEVKY